MRPLLSPIHAVRALLCALLLVALVPTVEGCAAAIPVVTAVATVVSEVASWLDVIDAKASETGALPPEVAARLAAVRAVVARLNDAARQGPAAYQAAVAEFERLYADLLRVVAPLGVRPLDAGGRLAAAAPGTVAVPSAGELGARLRAEGAR